jgi:hypothetical protein
MICDRLLSHQLPTQYRPILSVSESIRHLSVKLPTFPISLSAKQILLQETSF